jgi:hypothetical membrane protein
MTKVVKFIKGPIFPLFGIMGTTIIGLGCLIAAIAFNGPLGQSYSMANYFISELGGVQESELAIAFNLGVFLGGLILVVFMGGLFFYFTTKIGKFGSILGIFSGISGALVGIFPFDVNIGVHGLVAMCFFYGGMITVILMTIGLFLEKEHPYPFLLKALGIISGVFFIIFNFAMGDFAAIFSEPTETLDLENMSIDNFRPTGLWLMALFEWLSLVGMLVWIFATGVYFEKVATSDKN